MKVYVEDNNISNLDDLFQATNSYECWAGNCGDDLEIVSIADHTKQVRKEVCEEIRSFIEKPENSIYWDCSIYVETEELRNFLDQIQGDKK